MGTVVSIQVRGDLDATAAFRDAVVLLHEVDAQFSTYRADSAVSRFGRGEPSFIEVPELALVAAACADLKVATDGAFDAWAGGAFDPSAYVKGWAVDRVGAVLVEHGLADWSINAGGDVLVRARQDAPVWRIGVQHPFDPDALATTLQARRLAVATSGSYFRGGHILDPHTGAAAAGAASTTVIGPSLAIADALSTAAFVLGADGPELVSHQAGYECWTVLPDGRVLATAGFPRVVLGVPVSSSPTTGWSAAA